MDLHKQWPVGVRFDLDHVFGIFTCDWLGDIVRREEDLPEAAFAYEEKHQSINLPIESTS